MAALSCRLAFGVNAEAGLRWAQQGRAVVPARTRAAPNRRRGEWKMAEMRLKIDETIRRILMPLREDERALLEQSVLAEGIRDPLVVWKRADGTRILLDGHHRYELARQHGLDYAIVEMTFETEDDAGF